MASRAVEILVEERDGLEAVRDSAERDFADATGVRESARAKAAEAGHEIAQLNTAINALGGEPQRKRSFRR